MSRWISGIILAVAVVALLGWAPWWACGVVVLVVTLLASSEFVGLCLKPPFWPEKIVSVIFALWIVLLGALSVLETHNPDFIFGFLQLLLAFFCFFLITLRLRCELSQMFSRVVTLSFGLAYVAVPMSCLAIIILQPKRVFIFWLLAVTFLGDTVAYLFGKTFGGKKMAPRISPGKTWSGFGGSLVGGFVGSVATMLVAAKIMGGETDVLYYLACGGVGSLVAVFGVLGDLFESMIKRAVGVKDSGNLIPGHGGVLDRVDGLLFTAPVALLMQRGQVFTFYFSN